MQQPRTNMPPICSRPIFLLGSYRSGSQALACALSQHSDLNCFGSSELLSLILGNDPQGKPNPFLRAFKASTERLLPNWVRMYGVTRSEFLTYLGLGVNAFLTRQRPNQRWIDNSPGYVMFAPLVAEMFPDAQFLHLLRDGRRVVHSMIHLLDRFDAEKRADLLRSGECPWPWATDFRAACRAWRMAVESGSEFAKKHAMHCLTVRNESLVADPRKGFDEIYRFLAVQVEDKPIACFTNYRVGSSFHHEPIRTEELPDLKGLSSSLASLLVENHPYSVAEPWLEWDAEKKRIFIEEAGETLVACGYASDEELEQWGKLAHSQRTRTLPDVVRVPRTEVDQHRRRQIQIIASNALPSQCRVFVLQNEPTDLFELKGFEVSPLPVTVASVDTDIIASLEGARGAGSGFLLIPGNFSAWFETHQALMKALAQHYPRLWTDENCTIFQLIPRPLDAPTSGWMTGRMNASASPSDHSSSTTTAVETESPTRATDLTDKAAPLHSQLCSQPIFIIGSQRSGTHGLAFALARHSQLWTHHESEILYHLLEQDRVGRFLQEIGRRNIPSWSALQDVGRAELLSYLGLGLNALFTSRNAQKRWIDKTPEYVFIAEYLAEMFPDALFLHLLRDGRRVVHSMIHYLDRFPESERKALVSSGQVLSWAVDFRAACVYWRRAVKAGVSFAAFLPNRCLSVYNEKLVADPSKGFSSIFHFLGVPEEEACPSFFSRVRIYSSFRPAEEQSPPAGNFARPMQEWDEKQRRFFAEQVPYKDTEPWHDWTAEQKKIFAYEAGDWMLRCSFAQEDELRSWGVIRVWPDEGSPVPARVKKHAQDIDDPKLREIFRVVEAALSPNTRLLIVSEGEPQLLELGCASVGPFPQTADGRDAGTIDCDGDKAVENLSRLQKRGFDYLLIPSGAFAWLERCASFQRFLMERHRLHWRDERCRIFQLLSDK